MAACPNTFAPDLTFAVESGAFLRPTTFYERSRMARKASAAGADVATGASLTQDVAVGGSETLTVVGVVGSVANAAGASTDVVISVQPYHDDEKSDSSAGTLADVLIPAIETGTAVLANSAAQQFARFRVSGLRKVRISVKNNNAASKPVVMTFGSA
jgi:hypothetical protein